MGCSAPTDCFCFICAVTNSFVQIVDTYHQKRLLNKFEVSRKSTKIFSAAPAQLSSSQAPSRSSNLRPRPLLLALEQGQQRHVSHLDDLKPNAWDTTDGVAASTEARDQDLVVLLDVVQRTVVGDEGGDP